MNLQTLLTLLEEASVLSGHREFVVIGSLSILALESCFPVPEDMAMSNDIDCYTRNDPGRIFDVVPMLGENSPRHVESGYFIDAVSPALASLPEGWTQRMNRIESHGLIAWFLEPNDAALSKYARGEARDRRWIRAGIRSGVVSLPTVRWRMPSVNFLDEQERDRAHTLITEDEVWFQQLRAD